MELGIMAHQAVTSVAARPVIRQLICLKDSIKRPLSMEHGMATCNVCRLVIFIQVAPQFTLLYTSKLVTLINLGIQTMKLNGVYKYKRTGILPPGGHLISPDHPFKKIKLCAREGAIHQRHFGHKLIMAFLPALILRM